MNVIQQHRVDTMYLAEHPYVCEATLATFRYQIISLERLTPEKYQVLSMSSEQDANHLHSGDVAEKKHKRRLEQCQHVYERLSRLVRLQTLNLGGDIKSIGYCLFGGAKDETTMELNGRIHLLGSNPAMNGLEFSFSSDLAQLASLENLRLFRFERLAHWIEREELEWIADHWPRLSVMRGLHVDEAKTLARLDTKTAKLRQVMQPLWA
ncbi:hypothetical protein BGZ47_006524 [Haplosporangium gracile]|nr:hypothetical protein BGZ47_006524 [Haplosporangium gracile]